MLGSSGWIRMFEGQRKLKGHQLYAVGHQYAKKSTERAHLSSSGTDTRALFAAFFFKHGKPEGVIEPLLPSHLNLFACLVLSYLFYHQKDTSQFLLYASEVSGSPVNYFRKEYSSKSSSTSSLHLCDLSCRSTAPPVLKWDWCHLPLKRY